MTTRDNLNKAIDTLSIPIIGLIISFISFISLFSQLTTITSSILIIILTVSISFISIRLLINKRQFSTVPIVVIGLSTILIIVFFAKIYMITGLLGCEKVSFSTALYFSVVTWTTLGFGDITPLEASRIYAASEAFMGYIFMGLFVGLLFGYLNKKVNKQTEQ